MISRAARCFAALTSVMSLAGCSAGLGSSGSSCPASAVAASENGYTPLATSLRVPLTGCTSIDYAVAATVGSTAGTNLLIDSGSTTLGLASKQCTNCSVTPLYDPSVSGVSTCSNTSSYYGDGSGWKAAIYNDSVAIGSVPTAKVSIAAMTSQSNSFFSNYDCSLGNNGANSSQGIIGLAGSQIASSGTVGYMDALNAQSSFPGLFATQLCMTGGNIWFGNYDTSYTTSAALYTPIAQANTFFYVNLQDISIAGTSLGLSTGSFPGGTIVDTGTSIAVVPTAVYNAVVTALGTNSNFRTFIGASSAAQVQSWFDNGSCTISSQSESAIDSSLPALAMKFPSTTSGQTISVSLPASRSYLDLHKSGTTFHFCAGIAPDDTAGDPAIIGGSFLRSQITIFDRNSGRIGFAPQTGCAY